MALSAAEIKTFVSINTLLYKTVESPPKDGIYYITNNLSFPVQVVVTSRLNPETHSSLKILSNHADKKDVERFLAEAEKLSSLESLNNVDAVLQASVSANYELDVRVHNVRWTLVLNRPK